jgi:ribosomal protein S18 acetylase RimI-like enzyme
MLLLSSIDHRTHVVAQQVHAVRMAAYKQEAELLRVARFPPLEKQIDDILNSSEEFLGAFENQTLAGVLSVCQDEEGRGLSISSLVVLPAQQRRGVGRALVTAMIERHHTSEFTVQTAAANAPALALYAEFGFKEYRHWALGSEPLELVKLRRAPAAARSAA